MRTELATMPRAAQLDLDKFKMQAEGAVQLPAGQVRRAERASVRHDNYDRDAAKGEEGARNSAGSRKRPDRPCRCFGRTCPKHERRRKRSSSSTPRSPFSSNAKISMEQAAQQADKEREESTGAEVDVQVSELTAKLAARDEKIAAAMEEMKHIYIECCEANKLNETLDEKLSSLRKERDEGLAHAEAQTQSGVGPSGRSRGKIDGGSERCSRALLAVQ